MKWLVFWSMFFSLGVRGNARLRVEATPHEAPADDGRRLSLPQAADQLAQGARKSGDEAKCLDAIAS